MIARFNAPRAQGPRSMRTRIVVFATLLLGAGMGAGGCGSGTASGCVPGASVACACPGGTQGVQTCLREGTFGPCACEPAPAAAIVPPSAAPAAVPDESASAERPSVPGGPPEGSPWTSSPFQCHAVSTVRQRECHLEQQPNGDFTLTTSEIRCVVEFDAETGNPAALRDCSVMGGEVVVAARMPLHVSHEGMLVGGMSGWRWRDAQAAGGDPTYCCPGVWLAPPEGVVLSPEPRH